MGMSIGCSRLPESFRPRLRGVLSGSTQIVRSSQMGGSDGLNTPSTIYRRYVAVYGHMSDKHVIGIRYIDDIQKYNIDKLLNKF